jgi:hypothetical protein
MSNDTAQAPNDVERLRQKAQRQRGGSVANAIRAF